MISSGLVTMSYIAASVLFILSLSGLGHQETSRRGNYYGMAGMAIALIATILSNSVDSYVILMIALAVGGVIGTKAALKVKMTQMPELVAIMHSLVGMAAVLVGYANFIDNSVSLVGIEKTIHEVEIYIGIFIGAVTFSGSVIAFFKLCGKIDGKPFMLPGRHWLNLGLLMATVWLGKVFLATAATGEGSFALLIMTLIAFAFGVHMVMAIGGADMPVVVSMLNSYSGWAAAATGFMLNNDLLIVTGALVGSSGAILSYIMCRAMNRNFLSVIAGGFGASSGEAAAVEGEVISIDVQDASQLLADAGNIMIIPGYGMAVAHAQHTVNEITKVLLAQGKQVRFGIHPVAGRMPGHMNVLLAEAKVPYDIVFEMDEINADFANIDVSIVIGANDIVNPSALDDPNSPIAGMPVLECWKSATTIVLKRSMATGYAGIGNPLFVHKNTRMLFGDANESMQAVLNAINN
ncbi:MAG: Re/Si-specific NAD(P)(+) transhydrogenase subunit beta [Gammaproteobacteria bacterium]|nr:Re/Si-specific NAD(P)(+) transhydrogenase subunit beta [Gammaproteobacteria bacterium]MBT5221547.1 Re/Si-specific NAD(P)(+) transhydrogenase subunit beta [Gammaproteobacteria bacterium]MBT5825343.1 Re/Si-specific NAD(P)(+) transhydrogenase subunit beta [Gammaproteobacteria bacterium]MBT6419139.1 Re/Si-specific NAD(P)(+) transhydrogenase subunit beta [Gammaproteobacteria bacterium]MBT6576279.1 Re/Si-specific NAD(P)(+) transhydrogenase subunit beta [Gammaproteobacteria bacterium]